MVAVLLTVVVIMDGLDMLQITTRFKNVLQKSKKCNTFH